MNAFIGRLMRCVVVVFPAPRLALVSVWDVLDRACLDDDTRSALSDES